MVLAGDVPSSDDDASYPRSRSGKNGQDRKSLDRSKQSRVEGHDKTTVHDLAAGQPRDSDKCEEPTSDENEEERTIEKERYSAESEEEDENIATDRNAEESEKEDAENVVEVCTTKGQGEEKFSVLKASSMVSSKVLSETHASIQSQKVRASGGNSEEKFYFLDAISKGSPKVFSESPTRAQGRSPADKLTYLGGMESQTSGIDINLSRATESPRSFAVDVNSRSPIEPLSKIDNSRNSRKDSIDSRFILGDVMPKNAPPSPSGARERMGRLFRTSETCDRLSEESLYGGNDMIRADTAWKPFLRSAERRKHRFGSTTELGVSARDDDVADEYAVFAAHPVARAMCEAAEETGFDPSGFDDVKTCGLRPVYDQAGIFAPPTGQKYEVKLRRPTFSEFEQHVSQVAGVSGLSKNELLHVFKTIELHEKDVRLTRSTKIDVLKDMMKARYGLDQQNSVTLFAVFESLCGKYYGSFDTPVHITLKNVDNLLLVQHVHKQARQNGIRKGDILVSINSTLVGNMPEHSAENILNYLAVYSKYPVVLHWIRAHFTLRSDWVPPQTQEDRDQSAVDANQRRASSTCVFVSPDCNPPPRSHHTQRETLKTKEGPPLKPVQFRYDLRQRVTERDADVHSTEEEEKRSLEQPTPTSFKNRHHVPIDYKYLVEKCERSGRFSRREISFLHDIAQKRKMPGMQGTAVTESDAQNGYVEVADDSPGGRSRKKQRRSDLSVAKFIEKNPSNMSEDEDVAWNQYLELVKSMRKHPVSSHTELSNNRKKSQNSAPGSPDNRSLTFRGSLPSEIFKDEASKMLIPSRESDISWEQYVELLQSLGKHPVSPRAELSKNWEKSQKNASTPMDNRSPTRSQANSSGHFNKHLPAHHIKNQHTGSPSHIPTTTNVRNRSRRSKRISTGNLSPSRALANRAGSAERVVGTTQQGVALPNAATNARNRSPISRRMSTGSLSPACSLGDQTGNADRVVGISAGGRDAVPREGKQNEHARKRESGRRRLSRKRSAESLKAHDLREHRGTQTVKVSEYDGWVPPNRFTTPSNSVFEESCCFVDHLSGRLERNNRKLLDAYCRSRHENLVHDELERYHKSVINPTKPASHVPSDEGALPCLPYAVARKRSADDDEPDVANVVPPTHHVPSAHRLSSLPDTEGRACVEDFVLDTREPEKKISPSKPVLVDMHTQTRSPTHVTSGAQRVASPGLSYTTASKDYLVSPRDKENNAVCARCCSPLTLSTRSPTLSPNKPVSPIVGCRQNDATTSPRASQEKEECASRVCGALTDAQLYVAPSNVQTATLPSNIIPHHVGAPDAATDRISLNAQQFDVQWRPYVPVVGGMIPGTCFGTFLHPGSANTKMGANISTREPHAQRQWARPDSRCAAVNLSPLLDAQRQLHEGTPLKNEDTVRGQLSRGGGKWGTQAKLTGSMNDALTVGISVNTAKEPSHVNPSDNVYPPHGSSTVPNTQTALPRDGHRSSVGANAVKACRQHFTSPPSYLASNEPQFQLSGTRVRSPHRPMLREVDIDVVTPR